MEEKECNGCKFDLTDRVAESGKELLDILGRCDKCKRAKILEYQDGYEDLYLRK